MSDNLLYNQPGSGPSVATDDVGGIHYQRFKLDGGGDGVSVPLTGTVAFGLLVDVSRIAGTLGVTQSTTPWTVQGQVASQGSLAGQNPVAIGINSDGGTVRFATAVNSTASTTGAAILSVGAMLRAGDGNWYRPLGDTAGRQYVNQGIGNAADSPWAISGTVSANAAPFVASANNSSTSTLGASGVFLGTGDDLSNYGAVTVNIYSTVGSFPSGGVEVHWSQNNSNWDHKEVFTYLASGGFAILLRPRAQFFRLQYHNGATAQSLFRLETTLHPNAPAPDEFPDNGRVQVNGISYPIKQQAINATAAGDNTIITAVTNKRLRIVAITFTCAANVDISFKSGSSTTLINTMSFAKSGGPAVNFLPVGYFTETNAGDAFVMNLSGAVNVRGSLMYIEL